MFEKSAQTYGESYEVETLTSYFALGSLEERESFLSAFSQSPMLPGQSSPPLLAQFLHGVLFQGPIARASSAGACLIIQTNYLRS